MATPRALPAVLGAVAILPTTSTLVIHIILAQSRGERAALVKTTGIVAAILEAGILVSISVLTGAHLAPRCQISRLRTLNGLWFGGALIVCALATAVSVSNLISLSRITSDHSSTILGSKATSFLVGASVALGIAFASQLAFLVFHYVTGRISQAEEPDSMRSQENRARNLSPQSRVKSIAYHDTSPVSSKLRGSTSFDYRTPPGSSGGRSTAETMSSIRSSLSHAVRPISSKTRLLSGSQRSSRRPASLDLSRPHSDGDGFDSWDTSAVDAQNRQTVMESSSPPVGRFLETIPASPMTSRSPSPGTPLDLLEPPQARRRSRSYSPASLRTLQTQRAAFTQQVSQSESHIHPLFRSDSPAPPVIATPGTVVTAAPDAGRVISDRQSIRSIRSLSRIRSGSLPTMPSPLSPQATLSTQPSFDSFHRRAESSSPEIREEDEVSTPREASPDVERKMTPPIPDWILSGAGTRASMLGYNNRRGRSEGDEATPTASA